MMRRFPARLALVDERRRQKNMVEHKNKVVHSMFLPLFGVCIGIRFASCAVLSAVVRFCRKLSSQFELRCC